MNQSCLNFFIFCSLIVLFSSCRTFNSNRMFRTNEEVLVDSIQKQLAYIDKNYLIQKNDYIEVRVYTNAGERIIDPDYELSRFQGQMVKPEIPRFLVREDGKANLPMVGTISLDGYTLRQADSLLSVEYSKYYNTPFVVTKLMNKRVVVFGPQGGKVLPLENENVNLIEVIALYGGIDQSGKAFNIRLIRGDLQNPNVSIIDLSTVEGMKKATLGIEPNDIVYIETQRRILSESIREISPIISLITSLLVTIVLIVR